MYCNYCGKAIPADANLCAYCGVRVAGEEARQRLMRPREGRKVGGVCLGFAEYFDLDVVLVRVVWLLSCLFGLAGLLAYIVCWIVIPERLLALPSAATRLPGTQPQGASHP